MLRSIQSKVTKAVVYRTGAFVTREAQIHLEKGNSSLCFGNLSGSMVEETFQVSIPERVSCIQVSYDKKYGFNKEQSAVRESEELNSLRERMEELEDAITAVEFAYEIVSQKLTFAKRDEISVDELKEYVDYIYPKHTELLEKKRNLNRERKKLCQQIEQIEEEFKEKTKEKSCLIGALLLDVEVDVEGDYTIEITAYEKCVSWEPVYDIRVDNLILPMSVILKGKIYQNTGETWKNIELTVSNGNLLQSNNQPELKIWKLDFLQPYSSGRSVPPSLPMMSSKAGSLPPYPCMGNETCILGAGETTILETATLFEKESKVRIPNKVLENQTTIEYQLSGRYTLEDTSQGNMIEIIRKSVEAEYCYYITPKAECSAYLMAIVKNWRNMDWLECDANIFLENRYVGATHINPEKMDELLKISLGRDRLITVTRQCKKKNTSQQMLGNMQSRDFVYQVEIRNEKNQPVQIMVIDQIPVTENEKIIVEAVHAPGAELEPNSGKITWHARLNTGDKLPLTLGFRVRWPKGMGVNI